MPRSTPRSHPICATLCRAAALAVMLTGCSSEVVVHVGPEPEPDLEGLGVSDAAYACDAADSARPMLAARVNHALHFAYRDGSVREVHTFDVPDNGYIVSRPALEVRGDLIAAHALVAPLAGGDDFEPFAQFVVVDVDGAVRFSATRPFDYRGSGSSNHLGGRADGLFVHTMLETKEQLGLVVHHGEADDLGGRWYGLSDPDAQGRMVVRDYDAPSTAELAFVDIQTGVLTPSAYVTDPDRASSTTVVGTAIVYLDRNPSRLVVETADGRVETPIDVVLPPVSHAGPVHDHRGTWTLFQLDGQSPETARFLAIDVATGAHRELTMTPPAGLSLPGDYWNTGAIDEEGRILVPLSTLHSVQLHRTVDGKSWEALGEPLAQTEYNVKVVQAGGATVFDGHWSPGVRLVGPQGGAGIDLYAGDEPDTGYDNPTYFERTLSADGRCVAYFRRGTLRVGSTDDYVIRNVGLGSETQSAEAAFIPLAAP